MEWESITSKDNKLIRHMARLASDAKYRRASGAYVCEGEKLLWEAVRDGVELHAVLWERHSLAEAQVDRPEHFAQLEKIGCRCVSVPENVFAAASFLETCSGPLFVCSRKTFSLPETGRRFIVLDGVQDPGNVGTVLRTADAFSIDGVWFLEGSADPWQPKAVRAAMGSIFRVPIYRASADVFFDAMQGAGIPVYAAALTETAENIRTVSLDRCAVIIGNEGNGVRPACIARCEKSVLIPMSGRAESLNAAVAAAIIMWEMSGCL